ncbi:MAG: xanthine dehydrogenase [Deltaproteobacteria bacterium]|nr:MAG: xanthine dehydrogenase [Deltaproteobacteria bacterium]
MKLSMVQDLIRKQQERCPVALLTCLADGRQSLLTPSGLEGELALDEGLLSQARQFLAQEKSVLLGEQNEVFMRSYVPPARLFLIGAVHISQALAPMARLAGFEVTVIDPRRAFCKKERFPETTLHAEWPDDIFEKCRLDSQCAVVTLTHDPKIDDPALEVALQSDAFYIGALGSRGTHAQREIRLGEKGLGDQLPRIHAPVGLDLGGRAPAEIAVATLAQIVQVRYKGRGKKCKRSQGTVSDLLSGS